MAHQSTKQLIADEFYALTRKKNIDKITVKDVVEACDISRQTFYYHFRDLPDVIEWLAEELVNQTVIKSMEYEHFVDALEQFLIHFQGFSHLIRSMMYSNRRYEGEQILLKAIHQLIERLLKERLANQPMTLQDFELITDYHTYGLVGILIQYTTVPNFDAHHLAQQLNRMVQQINGSNLNK